MDRRQSLSLLSALFAFGTYFAAMRIVVSTFGLAYVGAWSLVMGVIAVVRLLDLSGSTSLQRMVATTRKNSIVTVYYIDSITIFTFFFYLILSIFLYILTFNFLTNALEDIHLDKGKFIFLCLISLSLNVIGLVQQSSLDGVGRADLRSYVGIGGSILFFLLCLYLLRDHGIIGLVFAQIIQHTFVFLLSRLVLVRLVPAQRFWPSRFSVSAVRRCLSYGIKLEFVSRPKALFDPIVRLLLAKAVSLEALGMYEFAYKIVIQSHALIVAYNTPKVVDFVSRLKISRYSAILYLNNSYKNHSILVSAAYFLLIPASVVISLILFREINIQFVAIFQILAAGHYMATMSILTSLFAQSVGDFKWSLLGQAVILVIGVATLLLSHTDFSFLYAAVLVSCATCIGSFVEYWGITHRLCLGHIWTRENDFLGTCASVAYLLISVILMYIYINLLL